MERLIVKNFGPLIDASIELKDINIYIGTTSSGKSTIAKLVSIFKSTSLRHTKERMDYFKKSLVNFNIDFDVSDDTFIRYEWNDSFYEIKDLSFNTNISAELVGSTSKYQGYLNPIYIPAERVFFSTLSQSVFGLINSDIALPKWLIDFGAKFESARSSIKQFPISFLNAKYEWKDGNDYIELENKTRIKLSQASSGIQSLVPLLLVVEHNTENGKIEDDLFVVEEPEFNLYPSSQKDLIEFIIERTNKSKDKLIITTHSPYLLTSIDNLIQAGNVIASNASLKEHVEELAPSSLWIKYSDVACYYFNEGRAKSTLDPEIQSIGPSNIDDVSIELSETFENLLTLKCSG
ncbi:AAA family ATPase [Olivibacter sp. 47]|jgi:energy-coupling factor transporter ATP-binding protein EcfA2|uniref:AAA family ATPase n=1 Tax=Olivibacter sp. 47 TaxID=3056486 RepID=UPI0025A45CA5|nr:AAA family ATPase [Olivibacter sp. 47]MDM8175970.1 AAA family ATPase [Olivibacter sp. 47]